MCKHKKNDYQFCAKNAMIFYKTPEHNNPQTTIMEV